MHILFSVPHQGVNDSRMCHSPNSENNMEVIKEGLFLLLDNSLDIVILQHMYKGRINSDQRFLLSKMFKIKH